MKKIITILLSSLLIVSLVACGSSKLDEATIKKYTNKAEDVVKLLNEQDYEMVFQLFDEQMSTALPVSEMSELTPIIEQSGNYEEIGNSSVQKQDGNYVVVLVAKYSDQNRTYTITFNEKDEIAGLYIK